MGHHLAAEAAEALRDPQVRSEEGHGFGQHDGGVEGELREAAFEHGQHLVGDLDRDTQLRFLGGRAQMRGGDDLRQAQQRTLAGRLLLEDVEGGPGDLPAAQGIVESTLVDDAPPGGVDQPRERDVDGEEVGLGQQPLERHHAHLQLGRPLLRDQGVGGDHLHPKGLRPAGHLAADVAQPDHAQRLLTQLSSQVERSLPPSLPDRLGSLGDVTCQGEHQGDCERQEKEAAIGSHRGLLFGANNQKAKCCLVCWSRDSNTGRGRS